MDEDWEVLKSFPPSGWRELARETGALKGLRKDRSVESLLRALLLHVGCGHSLRETVVRARRANLADLSAMALMKRLRKSRDWLHALCVELFRERGVAAAGGGLQVRAFDATTVREPGRTGSPWRIHHSVRPPSLACDFFRLTPAGGRGAGESLPQFPVRAGDHIIADRGHSTVAGLHHVAASGGRATVRVDTGSPPLRAPGGEPFDLLGAVRSLGRAGAVGSWPATAVGDGVAVSGRVCAIRKTRRAIRMAQDRLRREAARRGKRTRPQTLVFARCVILFTTFPEVRFTASEVLECRRLRWRVELVFKRFKSLAQLGHPPKRDDGSAKAWLYGKLLAALLVEKLIRHASAVSSWGCGPAAPAAQPVA